MKPVQYDDVVIFVDASANLAESVAQDIKDGGAISHNTVNFLSKFAEAAENLKNMFDKIENDKVKLN